MSTTPQDDEVIWPATVLQWARRKGIGALHRDLEPWRIREIGHPHNNQDSPLTSWSYEGSGPEPLDRFEWGARIPDPEESAGLEVELAEPAKVRAIATRLEEIAEHAGDVTLDDEGKGILCLASELHGIADGSPAGRPVVAEPRDETPNDPPPGWKVSMRCGAVVVECSRLWVKPLAEAWAIYRRESAPHPSGTAAFERFPGCSRDDLAVALVNVSRTILDAEGSMGVSANPCNLYLDLQRLLANQPHHPSGTEGPLRPTGPKGRGTWRYDEGEEAWECSDGAAVYADRHETDGPLDHVVFECNVPGRDGYLIQIEAPFDIVRAAASPPDGTAPERAPESCSNCRQFWERRGLCAHKSWGDPGRRWSEPSEKPSWCPGWTPERDATRPPDGMPGEPAARSCPARMGPWVRDTCPLPRGHEGPHVNPPHMAAPPTVPGEPPRAGPKRPEYEPKTVEQKLGYLVEESGEVLAAIGKTMRWGWQSFNPELPPEERETNEAWMRRELHDLDVAVGKMLDALGSPRVAPLTPPRAPVDAAPQMLRVGQPHRPTAECRQGTCSKCREPVVPISGAPVKRDESKPAPAGTCRRRSSTTRTLTTRCASAAPTPTARKESFSSHWLDEAIAMLTAARDYLRRNAAPDMHDGRQYGYTLAGDSSDYPRTAATSKPEGPTDG